MITAIETQKIYADHGIDLTPAEIAEMAQLTKEAMEAGALGFSTSRTIGHRSLSGSPVP